MMRHGDGLGQSFACPPCRPTGPTRKNPLPLPTTLALSTHRHGRIREFQACLAAVTIEGPRSVLINVEIERGTIA